jgi:hypothetical protein
VALLLMLVLLLLLLIPRWCRRAALESCHPADWVKLFFENEHLQ